MFSPKRWRRPWNGCSFSSIRDGGDCRNLSVMWRALLPQRRRPQGRWMVTLTGKFIISRAGGGKVQPHPDGRGAMLYRQFTEMMGWGPREDCQSFAVGHEPEIGLHGQQAYTGAGGQYHDRFKKYVDRDIPLPFRCPMPEERPFQSHRLRPGVRSRLPCQALLSLSRPGEPL